MEYGSYYTSEFVSEIPRNSISAGDTFQYIFAREARQLIIDPSIETFDYYEFFGGKPLKRKNDRELVVISMLTVVHELSHMLQDFSTGCEFMRDILFDLIGSNIVELIKAHENCYHTIKFPLRDNERYENYLKINTESNNYIKTYDQIYESSTQVEFNYREQNKRTEQISTNDLLEALAVAKAYQFVANVEPNDLRSELRFINKNFYNSNMDPEYEKAWAYYKSFCSFENVNDTGEVMTEALNLDMIGFIMLCDISLHIPPCMEALRQEKLIKVPDECIPHKRFENAVKSIKNNGGYPDKLEGIDFYITLYDFIANDYGWPSFQETQDMWKELFISRMKHAFVISDYFRLRALTCKSVYADYIIHPLGDYFIRTGIPVLIHHNAKNDSFNEFFQFVGGVYTCITDGGMLPLQDPYLIMVQIHNNWGLENYIDFMMREEDMLFAKLVAPNFLREIYCRLLYKNFFQAVKEKPYFSCPLASYNCLSKMKECECLKKLTSLPHRCSLEIWLKEMNIDSEYIYWEE